jgi:hypothetical protein
MGKGKMVTKEEPAKDLGHIIELLEPGDTDICPEVFTWEKGAIVRMRLSYLVV